MKLKDKVVLITGAASGIGKATALKFALDKPKLIISDIDKVKLDTVADEIKSMGYDVEAVKLDVTNPDEINSLFLKIVKDYGQLDIVFSNAGLGFMGPIWEWTIDQIKKTVDVNVFGNMYMSKFASEVFIRQQSGHLILTSSLGGLVAIPQSSVYVGSKWAVTGFADTIRIEMKKYNVKVTTIHPGAVKTVFFDEDKANIDVSKVGDMVEASVVADAVYSAALTDRKKVFVPAAMGGVAALNGVAPGVVEMILNQMTKDAKYHDDVEEDEPEFSNIQPLKTDK